MEQYSRNMGIINNQELTTIMKTKVLLVGVGGLGGYIACSLVRLGVENITIIDSDNFELSNLNRQIFATIKTLNKSKVAVTKEKLLDINPYLNIKAIHSKFDENIDESIFKDVDIIIDAVDNIKSKLLIEKYASINNIPLIHGAIGGWYGQLGVILPGSDILKEIYKNKVLGVEDSLKSPTFIPGIVGNLMISEFIKFILKKGALLNQILYLDVLEHDYQIIYKK